MDPRLNSHFFSIQSQLHQPSSHLPFETPHSVHSFNRAPNIKINRHNYATTSMDDNIIGYHFRDREREFYERQVEFERELDQER